MGEKTLAGKTVVVTGGSLGIGFAVAKQASSCGPELILISRHEKDLKKAVSELPSDHGQIHRYYVLDVSRSDQVKKFAANLKKTKTIIHGLVNAAGVLPPIGKTEDISPQEFEKTFQTILFGTFNMCHYLIPLLKKSPRGKIVNFSGGGATGAFPNYTAYAVSKIGVVKLTENLAAEYKNENIDVNAIAPGFVITRMHENTLRAGKRAGIEYLEKTRAEIARGGTPVKHAAELVFLLLSSAADGVSGKLISAPWDPWNKADFIKHLKDDKDFGVLRRIDDQFFFKKPI